MSLFTGAGVALVTPFQQDGSVNYDVLGELIEFQLENNTDALIICGTTGEASTLSDAEQIEVIKFAVEKTKKRVPVIAGAGSNYTDHGIELCKESQRVGADGLLIVTPYYNKTSQAGLIQYYTRIAASVDLPIIMYSVPSRTGLNIIPETCAKLAEIENIVAVKEATGDIAQVAKIASICGDKLDIYSGNDDCIVPIMSLGGKGVISVLSNIIPKDVHDMVDKYLKGDVKGSMQLQLRAMELVDALFCEVNPIPVKKALNFMGLNVGGYREPLIEMSDANAQRLKDAMVKYSII